MKHKCILPDYGHSAHSLSLTSSISVTKRAPPQDLLRVNLVPFLYACALLSEWKQNQFLLPTCLHFRPHYINVVKMELSNLSDFRAKASLF